MLLIWEQTGDLLDSILLRLTFLTEAAMNATQESTLKEDFLEWSGRTPPDSPFEIFTYCELSLPFG